MSPNEGKPLAVGDIRKVVPPFGSDRESKLVLVVRLSSEREYAEIMLVHTTPAMSNHRDIIVHAENAEEEVYVVQTRARGIVWYLQFGHAVHSLRPDDLDRIKTALVSGASLNRKVPANRPEISQSEGFHEFMESQQQVLWSISRDCTTTKLRDEWAWRLDPRLIDPLVVRQQTDPNSYMGKLMHVLATHNIHIAEGDRSDLIGAEILDPNMWESILTKPDTASEIVAGVVPLLCEQISARAPDLAEAGDLVPLSHLRLREMMTTDKSNQLGLGIVTAPELWSNGIPSPLTDSRSILPISSITFVNESEIEVATLPDGTNDGY